MNKNLKNRMLRVLLGTLIGFVTASLVFSLFCYHIGLDLDGRMGLFIAAVSVPALAGVLAGYYSDSMIPLIAVPVISTLACLPFWYIIAFTVGLIRYIAHNPMEGLLSAFLLSLVFAPAGGLILLIFD